MRRERIFALLGDVAPEGVRVLVVHPSTLSLQKWQILRLPPPAAEPGPRRFVLVLLVGRARATSISPSSERDVVIVGNGCRRRHGRAACRCELVGGALSATAAATFAATNELRVLGDDLDGLALGAVLGIPRRHSSRPSTSRPSHAQVARARPDPPDGHIEVVRPVGPLTAVAVLDARVTAMRSLHTELPLATGAAPGPWSGCRRSRRG